MKTLISCLFLVSCLLAPKPMALAQGQPFATLLAAGKAEFKKSEEQQDFAAAVAALEKAVQLQPASAEAHYFLANAYARLNSKSGENLTGMRATLTQKVSRELAVVNQLEPRYRGELLVLDPPAKLTSEWGALALAYAARQQPDSVRWALAEGQRLGGFDGFLLAYAHLLLDQCRPASILLTSGDLVTFPVLYAQLREGKRRDVSSLDLGLLAATWYPAYLERTSSVRFALSPAARDTLDAEQWATQPVSIPTADKHRPLRWQVPPSYEQQYLLRNDLLLLALLYQNASRREVYFARGIPVSYQLGLEPGRELQLALMADRLDADHSPELTHAQYLSGLLPLLESIKLANPNSLAEREMIVGIRFDMLMRLQQRLATGHPSERLPLLHLIDRYLPPATYPFAPGAPEAAYYEQVQAQR